MVAFRDGTLAIIEVKSRRSTEFGDPLEAISSEKQMRVRRAAHDLLAAPHGMLAELRITRVRFDAASVLGTQVEILKDAF